MLSQWREGRSRHAAHYNHKDQRTRLYNYIMQKEQECQNRPAVKAKQHFCIFLNAEKAPLSSANVTHNLISLRASKAPSAHTPTRSRLQLQIAFYSVIVETSSSCRTDIRDMNFNDPNLPQPTTYLPTTTKEPNKRFI